MLPWVWVTVCWAHRTFPLWLFGCQLSHTCTNDLACALSCNLITDWSVQALVPNGSPSDLHDISQRFASDYGGCCEKCQGQETFRILTDILTLEIKKEKERKKVKGGKKQTNCGYNLLTICQKNKKCLMFVPPELWLWRHTARCERSPASYASHRKLDKRIILIALAQRFPSSRSTWWSARSPPCYSLCASQVSKYMSVFISQVALA